MVSTRQLRFWCGATRWQLLSVALVCLISTTSQAEPAFARMYKQHYGYPPSCNACHKDGGGTPLNGFGEQFKDAGMKAAAFATISGLDADGDGVANAEEAMAKANPGAAQSTPSAPGKWLDTASLIPREIQALFPEIRTYLPKDAVLTEKELGRAQAMGVTLTKDDENTIYIPVVDRRPAGTALIFPATHNGRQFFLLLATDRTLTVSVVQPLNTRLVPAADDEQLYRRFAGLSVKDLPQPQGQGLESDITAAVKKAGTLLWVRLKGA